MASISTAPSSETFASLYAHIKTFPPPLFPPDKTCDPSMTDRIASLYVHPTLECLLHILNHDLYSAHFLVRHMQSAPALEGMYIHGILHRIEGDLPNCLAWYGDVASSPAFTSFYGTADDSVPAALQFLSSAANTLAGPVKEEDGEHGGLKDGPRLVKNADEGKAPSQRGARAFIAAIEELGGGEWKEGHEARKAALEKVSRAEIEALMRFCADKFGTGKVTDARGAWVKQDEEHRQINESMVSGDEGYRQF